VPVAVQQSRDSLFRWMEPFLRFRDPLRALSLPRLLICDATGHDRPGDDDQQNEGTDRPPIAIFRCHDPDPLNGDGPRGTMPPCGCSDPRAPARASPSSGKRFLPRPAATALRQQARNTLSSETYDMFRVLARTSSCPWWIPIISRPGLRSGLSSCSHSFVFSWSRLLGVFLGLSSTLRLRPEGNLSKAASWRFNHSPFRPTDY